MPITYTPLTNFAVKDQMPEGDPGKIIRGVDFSAEFDEISRLFLQAVSSSAPITTLAVDDLTVRVTASVPTPADNTNKGLAVNIAYLESSLGSASIQATTGVADADKIVKTDANGVLDHSFYPDVWYKNEYIVTFADAAGTTGLPVLTAANGLIDPTILPTNSMVVHGSVDVTQPMAITPTWGDVYFVQTKGTVDASWTGIGGQAVEIGDQLTFGSDGNWHIMPNIADLAGYLPLAGGTMTGYMTTHADPVNAMEAANKQYVDAIKNAAVSASTGTPDANKLVQTGANGRLDITMMPTSALRSKGGLDPTVAPPAGAMDGDMYFLSKDGVFNTAYGAPLNTTTGHSGDVFLYANGAWHHVPSSADLKPFVLKIGDTMTGDLKYASPPADNNSYTNKLYVDQQVATRLTQAQVDARVTAVGNPLYAAIADKYPGNAAINALINAQSYTKAQSDAKYALATAALTQAAADARYVNVTGDTMTGALNITPAGGNAATTALNVTGKIVASGDIWGLSDDRLKDAKEAVIDAGDALMTLSTFTYEWSEEAAQKGMASFDDDRRMLGLSAQEVERVFPEAVEEIKGGYKTVSYNKMVVPLIEAVQTLTKRVQDLEAQLNDD